MPKALQGQNVANAIRQIVLSEIGILILRIIPGHIRS
jgi:hypothetical protein